MLRLDRHACQRKGGGQRVRSVPKAVTSRTGDAMLVLSALAAAGRERQRQGRGMNMVTLRDDHATRRYGVT